MKHTDTMHSFRTKKVPKHSLSVYVGHKHLQSVPGVTCLLLFVFVVFNDALLVTKAM
jgi:hypothetical protein